MKSLTITLFIFITSSIFCQDTIPGNPQIDRTKYAGKVNKSFFEELSEPEQSAFLECLSECNLSMDSLHYVDSILFNHLSKGTFKGTEKIVWKRTNEIGLKSHVEKYGEENLPIPQYILFVERNTEYTKFTFQVYY